jgi:hypothetical protein
MATIAEGGGSFEIKDIDAKLSMVERETAIDMIISTPSISTPVKRVLFCLGGEALCSWIISATAQHLKPMQARCDVFWQYFEIITP